MQHIINLDIVATMQHYKKENNIDNKNFMSAKDVSEVMEVFISYTYKLVREMNEELKNNGVLVIEERFLQHF